MSARDWLVTRMDVLIAESVYHRNHKKETSTPGTVVWRWDEDEGIGRLNMASDTPPPTPDSKDVREWALYYASRGWPVLPLHTYVDGACTCIETGCKSKGKHPRLKHGLKEATTALAQVEAWWKRWPDANIGLCTGVAFDVIDVDGDVGRSSIQEAEETHGTLPYGLGAATGGGGYHALFMPVGCGNRASMLPKVDYRGKGGYIVAPPSNHESGMFYEWGSLDHLSQPLPELPQWMREIVDPPHRTRQSAIPLQFRVFNKKGITEYGKNALNAELKELSRAQEGMRNHQLNISSFNLYQLVGGGELTEEVVDSQLEIVALDIGLEPHEIHGTMQSAKRAGMDLPRQAPVPAKVREMSIEERIERFKESGSNWWRQNDE